MNDWFRMGLEAISGIQLFITVLSLIVVAFFIPAAAYSIARNMSKKKAFAIMYSLLILGIFVPFQVIMIPITVMMSKLGLANMWGLVLLYLTYAIPQTLFLVCWLY